MKLLLTIFTFCFISSNVKAQYFPYFYTPLQHEHAPFYQTHLVQYDFSAPEIYQNFHKQADESSLKTETKSFKGFGYHTNYLDGATSTVVFLSGPSAVTSNSQEPMREKITVASDSLDPQQSRNLEQNIHDIFEEQSKFKTNSKHSVNMLPVIQSFFEKPESLSNLVYFYSEPEIISPSIRSRSLDIEKENIENKNMFESTTHSEEPTTTTTVSGVTIPTTKNIKIINNSTDINETTVSNSTEDTATTESKQENEQTTLDENADSTTEIHTNVTTAKG